MTALRTRFLRGVVAMLLGIGLSCVAAPVSAQQAGPPSITWLSPSMPSDANGAPGSTDPLGPLMLEPLRLGLLSLVPTPGGRDGGCSSPEMAGGATAATPGFPMARALGVRLAPRLSLFGFSRGGCATDGALGSGVSYAVPIRPNVFFVAGGGAIFVPNGGPSGQAMAAPQLRSDLVFQRPGGRAVMMGVSTRGLHVGGLW